MHVFHFIHVSSLLLCLFYFFSFIDFHPLFFSNRWMSGCSLPLYISSVKVKLKLLSRVRLLVTPWTAAHQAPPSMGFPRQVYWSGVPLPSPGDLPNPGIEPGSPALQADALPSEPPGKSYTHKGDKIKKTGVTQYQQMRSYWNSSFPDRRINDIAILEEFGSSSQS